jgi:hypothetical protein
LAHITGKWSAVNTKKTVVIIVCLGLLLIGLHLLSLDRPAKTESVRSAAEKFGKLRAVLKKTPIDVGEVVRLYEGDLEAFVHSVDQAEDIHLTPEIRYTIETTERGTIPSIAAELMQGAILRSFFLFLQSDLARLELDDGMEARVLSNAEAALSTWLPVLADAGVRAGVGNELVDRGRNLMTSISNGAKGSSEQKSSIAQLTDLLKGVSILQVLFGVEDFEKARLKDKMLALTHMAHAKSFYNVIYEDHAVADRESAIFINAEFIKQPPDVDVNLIRRELATFFAGRIPELAKVRFKAVSEESQ